MPLLPSTSRARPTSTACHGNGGGSIETGGSEAETLVRRPLEPTSLSASDPKPSSSEEAPLVADDDPARGRPVDGSGAKTARASVGSIWAGHSGVRARRPAIDSGGAATVSGSPRLALRRERAR